MGSEAPSQSLTLERGDSDHPEKPGPAPHAEHPRPRSNSDHWPPEVPAALGWAPDSASLTSSGGCWSGDPNERTTRLNQEAANNTNVFLASGCNQIFFQNL